MSREKLTVIIILLALAMLFRFGFGELGETPVDIEKTLSGGKVVYVYTIRGVELDCVLIYHGASCNWDEYNKVKSLRSKENK